VSLSGDALTIRGEKKERKDQSHRGYRLSERRYGMFERTFALPTGVDASGIAAEFSKGVLHVTLPKTPQAKKEPKKIAVKSA
jgi:HSP20 family protein